MEDEKNREEAEEEGVIFKNLTNPIEIVKDENGHIKEVVLQVMELGEPDESGRRKPVPVEGKTETIQLDTLIQAIGQAVDASIFDCDKTRSLSTRKSVSVNLSIKIRRVTVSLPVQEARRPNVPMR